MGLFAQDTFTASNGTSINGRTADSGGTWAIPSWGVATGAIQNNRAYGGNTFSAFSLSDAAASGNYMVSCDLVYTGAGGINLAGIYGRMDGSGNGYGLYRDTNSIDLYRYDTGTATLLVSVSRTYEDCNILLDMNSSTLEAFVIEAASGNYVTAAGGTQVGSVACISTTDANHSAAGLAGMYLNNGVSTTRLHIDNFQASEAEVFTETITSTMALVGASLVVAYRRPLYLKDGKRIARLPAGEFLNGTNENEFLAVTLVDTSDADYYYYGGLDETDAWQINKYDRTNLQLKTIANEILNPTKTSLASAWTDRTSLVYA